MSITRIGTIDYDFAGRVLLRLNRWPEFPRGKGLTQWGIHPQVGRLPEQRVWLPRQERLDRASLVGSEPGAGVGLNTLE
jgi:hypothetical protein